MKKISAGSFHALPHDIKDRIQSSKKLVELWEHLTPLARNEWICWIESAKKLVTRNGRMRRAQIELQEGKRRPGCWGGCVHRHHKK